MEGTNRTKIVYLNSVVTLVCQFLQILMGFVVRKIFINTLGVEYLGYNSVFLNILQMLNLADLGVGVAITSFLFKPLADGDNARVAALMYIYKKIYSIIGSFVLAVGVVISFFIGVLIPDANCSMYYLRVLYFINLAGTVATYFLAYKRTLIIADQKSYLTNFVDMIIYFVASGLQIFFLFTSKNYIIYLLIQVGKSILANIILSIEANRIYGKTDHTAPKEIVEEYKPQIIAYVKDVFVSRIGATVFYGTDNVIISVFKGSLLAGYLSNYAMITTQLTNVVNQVFASLQATFGNYIYSGKNKKEQQQMTENYFCVNFFIGNFCFICFTLLAQPFVKLFFGETLMLSFSTAMWLGINLMLGMLLQLPSQVFIIYKLFNYDKPIIVVSAILNIVISALLVQKIGLNGVLIGTFVTSLIYLFSRFFVISKYVFDIRYIYYVKKILLYFGISIVSEGLTWIVCRDINGDTVFNFMERSVIIGLLAILIPSTLLSFTEEFKFLIDKMLPSKIKKHSKSYVFVGFSIATIIIAVYLGDVERIDFSTAGNKSYARTDSYVVEENTGKNIFSLSFDDTILLFEDIKENNYDSIFQNTTLKWYKELHDKYGVVISCYCYYENNNFNLSQFPDKYKDEFKNNSDWLRFGFHTINGETDYQTGDIVGDYVKTVQELERIVGEDSIDNVIRLQRFQGSYEGIKKLTQLPDQPIVGLLTADDNRKSYYLNSVDNFFIYNHDEIYDTDTELFFFSTDFRIEYVDNINFKLKELDNDCWNNQTADLVVFSHEWALSMENKNKIEKVCKYAHDKKYRFSFFEDIV